MTTTEKIERIAKCLAVGWNIAAVGTIKNAIVLEPAYNSETYRQDGVWKVSDNGGELNVERVNDPESYRPAAYGFGVNTETLAYRVAMIILGHEIDYAFRLADGDLDASAGMQQ